jgi:hypothetical protein
MLINLMPLPDYNAFSEPQLPLSTLVNETRYRAEEPGYDKQLMFAQVTGVDRPNNLITIDGGAFEIFPASIARSATYLVHLEEVIYVYERTVAIER